MRINEICEHSEIADSIERRVTTGRDQIFSAANPALPQSSIQAFLWASEAKSFTLLRGLQRSPKPLYFVASNMANPRLPFLYPNFFRSIKSCEPNTWRSIRTPPSQKRCLKASLHTSQRRAQETFPQRYGPAAGEPRLPPPSKPSEPLFPNQQKPQNEAAKSEPEVTEAKSRASNNTEPETKPSQKETQPAGSP